MHAGVFRETALLKNSFASKITRNQTGQFTLILSQRNLDKTVINNTHLYAPSGKTTPRINRCVNAFHALADNSIQFRSYGQPHELHAFNSGQPFKLGYGRRHLNEMPRLGDNANAQVGKRREIYAL